MNCEFCQSPAHVWFQCPKKPEGWKPVRLAKESTASRKDEDSMRSDNVSEGRGKAGAQVASIVHVAEPAGTQALPVDTNSSPRLLKGSSGVGLASPACTPDVETANTKGAHKFDKVAYQRLYMRRRRAKAKEGQSNG